MAAFLLSMGEAPGQTPLNLDANPHFDFGTSPPVDPLFTPGSLGLATGQPGFDDVDALQSFAAQVGSSFPASLETFVAYWGNPGYAVLASTPLLSNPPAAASPLSLVGAFRGAATVQAIYPGRTASFIYAESTPVTVGGLLYHLPGAERYVSPLVLDLDGDGRLSASGGLWQPHPGRLTGPYAAFDIDGDGYKDVTEWIGAGDGLLTTSLRPGSGQDLVGTAGGWPDGFTRLRALRDLDGDGLIREGELDGLFVWQDANTNGVADTGEVMPVQSLGLAWLSTVHTNSQSAFGRADGTGGLIWDWWPNYALAIRRAAGPAGAGHPLLGRTAMAAIQTFRVFDNNSPPRTTSLPGPIHISPVQMAMAGIDLATFRMGLLADGGRVIIGYDTISAGPGRPRSGRILRIRPGPDATAPLDVAAITLPFVEVYQVACSPSGRFALVLGDCGSKLALADFEDGRVRPAIQAQDGREAYEIASVGLRASGLAGDPMVRYSGTGNLWFSAWELDAHTAVVDERVWAITPWGFWGGLSLESLKNELGQLRSHFVTGPTSGFFATPTPGGPGETLWWVNGTNRVAVARADNFGGMHAVGDQVTYTWRTGNVYGWDFWWASGAGDNGASHVAIASSSAPYFYPFLTDGGGTAIAAQFSLETGAICYLTSPGHKAISEIICVLPGQARVALGAFAHYGTNGIDILPMPESVSAVPPAPVWNYTLLASSQLTDECPVCDRMPIVVPMRGTFGLRLIQENPVFTTYALEDINFQAGGPAGMTYKVRGRGIYHVGGEVGRLQDMFLEVGIDNGVTNVLCYLTNAVPTVTRGWPLIQITLGQTNGTATLQYGFELAAAPVREIWFSTTAGFTPGVQPPKTGQVQAGDLVSSAGHVVKRNRDLIGKLGLMPSPDPPDLGLDAVDVLPRGEVAFSTDLDVFSETLGPLHHGDLLSDHGRIVHSYADLVAPFGPMPPIVDPGLDAAQVLDNGETYFSIETDFFSERLGLLIRRGDLLSSSGRIAKTREELLAGFHPLAAIDFGVDALHVWPSGEVWFSLEEGFRDDLLGDIRPGDILSDRGEVLYRNLELLREFQPLEERIDFGLDALYIVSDALAPQVSTAGGTVLRADRQLGDLLLRWEAQGRLYQVEKAGDVLGPWTPLGTIGPTAEFTDSGVLITNQQAFYRLREW